MPFSKEPESRIPALFTDLYEITMAAAYWDNSIDSTATFNLFFRTLPTHRNYFIVCGIEKALDYILHLDFNRHEINYIQNLEIFKNVSQFFFDYLSILRFKGTVRAVPEGTFVFPNEPVMEITAPIIEAQIIETALLSLINFETMVASKASRIVRASGEKSIVEFGSRRAHGPGAAVAGARAAYIGGCEGTSNLEAGMLYNIPVFGTIAHSFIMAHDDESTAYENFAKTFPDHVILLIDTYDTLNGAKLAAKLGDRVKGVRIDSGDLLSLSREVRKILDSAGLKNTQIMASGDLNEDKIRSLINDGAPIDSFGVGSELITSKDAPTMSGVYKLVETMEQGQTHFRIKLSKDKSTLPGRKQVYRLHDENGMFMKDIIAADGELDDKPEFTPLMKTYIKDGELIEKMPDLEAIRGQVQSSLKCFSEQLLNPSIDTIYPVELSDQMRKMQKQAKLEHQKD